MADVSLRTASEEHFSMGQNRCVWSSCSIAGCRTVLSKNQFGPLRSGRFVAARYSLLPYGLFFHLLFANLAQTGPIARSPASTDDDGPETPATS